VHDAGWSAFLRMLEYKAQLHGRSFARVGMFEPTTQMCSACGVKDGRKPLHVREWTCPQCGTLHDRDVNAAKNILAAGRAESRNACRGNARSGATLAAACEAGSRRSAA
jgi:putative transposase